MENSKFKSQICTTEEQSERLLAQGLKKQTADMFYSRLSRSDQWNLAIGLPLGYDVFPSEYLLPAWSLHRLIEMIVDTPLQVGSQVGIHVEDTYDMVIQGIEWLIGRGQFNKDYLEEKK